MDVLRYRTPGTAPVELDDRFRMLAINAPVLIWRCATDMRCDWVNRAWLDFTGRILPQELGRGWIESLHPEDRDRYMTVLTRAGEERRPFVVDCRLLRHDGVYRWIRGNCVPYTDEGGDFAGYVGSGVDVTDHVQQQEKLREANRQQAILLDELNHRTKNIAASIQSIACQTLKRANVDREVVDKVEHRLMSLAHANSLLASRRFDGVSLKALLTGILHPYDQDVGGQPRIALSGDDMDLPSDWVMLLGLSIHELATNACKYGSLSVEAGRVFLSWKAADGPRGRCVAFEWREVDGPPVEPPQNKGFGMTLMERGIGVELRGDVNLRFLPDGVVWNAEIPLCEEAVRIA